MNTDNTDKPRKIRRDNKGRFIPGNPGGRPVGSKNKNSRDIKAAFRDLVAGNIDNLDQWINEVAKEKPERALEIIIKLSDFVVPKMRNLQINSLENLSDEELDELVNLVIKKHGHEK